MRTAPVAPFGAETIYAAVRWVEQGLRWALRRTR